MKINLFYCFLVALVWTSLLGCSNEEETSANNERRDIDITRTEEELIQQNNHFALRMIQAIQDGNSHIVSPLSTTLVLAMINNGADGETKQQISKTLGFDTIDTENVNRFCKKLLTESPSLDRQVKLKLANNIFMNKEYSLLPGFTNTIKDYYSVTPEEYDFNSSKTLEAINRWCNDYTDGCIPKVLEELDPDGVSCLLSAVYFNGTWKDKFSKNATQDKPFYGGKKRQIPMMQRTGAYEYAENDTLQLLQLPYGNGAFLMTVMLPHQDKSLDDMLELLDGWEFDNIHQTIAYKTVEVWLPTFETKTDIDLIDIMSKLGMPKAFSKEAEFPAFCNTPTFISVMKQSSRIKVSEEGTEAASASVAKAGYTDYIDPFHAEFHADRPFIYLISEKSTGAIFFVGSYLGD